MSDLVRYEDLSCQDRREINDIIRYPDLIELNISLNKVTEISLLANLITLTDLDISYNLIISLEPLEKLTNLQRLKINNNPTKEINILSSLINLKSLRLDNRQFNQLNGLSRVDNLELSITYYDYSHKVHLSIIKDLINQIKNLSIYDYISVEDFYKFNLYQLKVYYSFITPFLNYQERIKRAKRKILNLIIKQKIILLWNIFLESLNPQNYNRLSYLSFSELIK